MIQSWMEEDDAGGAARHDRASHPRFGRVPVVESQALPRGVEGQELVSPTMPSTSISRRDVQPDSLPGAPSRAGAEAVLEGLSEASILVALVYGAVAPCALGITKAVRILAKADARVDGRRLDAPRVRECYAELEAAGRGGSGRRGRSVRGARFRLAADAARPRERLPCGIRRCLSFAALESLVRPGRGRHDFAHGDGGRRHGRRGGGVHGSASGRRLALSRRAVGGRICSTRCPRRCARPLSTAA